MPKSKHDIHIITLAKDYARQITQLSEGASSNDVAKIFTASSAPKSCRREAFWLMDAKPRYFESHDVWHGRIRALRNDQEANSFLFEETE